LGGEEEGARGVIKGITSSQTGGFYFLVLMNEDFEFEYEGNEFRMLLAQDVRLV